MLCRPVDLYRLVMSKGDAIQLISLRRCWVGGVVTEKAGVEYDMTDCVFAQQFCRENNITSRRPLLFTVRM